METDYTPVVKLWSEEYSSALKAVPPFEICEQFKRIAAVFSPGLSYYYIMNMQTLHIEYICPEVEHITGIPPEEATIQKLLSTALSNEVEGLVKKELVIKDFFRRYLSPQDLTSYKIVYSYRMKDIKGNHRHILHQAVVLSVSDEGNAQHVISIHSDISHLKLAGNQNVSFISLDKDKSSYYNLDVDDEKFAPKAAEGTARILSELLSKREKEILCLLAKGHTAGQIAKILHLSYNTVRTHRKNMLKKTRCANTAELVAQALMEGIMS